MNYSETIQFLYAKLPAFQKLGKKALKPKLTNIISLCEALGNPQNNFKSIHVAGTNGKGSSSHFLASILMESGLKVGLYTSPHLKDYKERFKINGIDADEAYIIQFVENCTEIIEKINPSFFELSVALAFKYFSDEKVDIAVIEVGLGGRYDSTNIISNKILSLITNIGFDHMDILGDTLPEIAYEKAGIIKENIPTIVSEYLPETIEIFKKEASRNHSKLYFASDLYNIRVIQSELDSLKLEVKKNINGENLLIESGLLGEYQKTNIIGILASCEVLNQNGLAISEKDIVLGIKNVVDNTKLKGRWQILHRKPLIICDTGHNEHALAITLKKISAYNKGIIHFILGFVKDKDLKKVFPLLPKDAKYYFCTFDSFRALKPLELSEKALEFGINSSNFLNVNQALDFVKKEAKENDLVFIGGSTYLVAEINNL